MLLIKTKKSLMTNKNKTIHRSREKKKKKKVRIFNYCCPVSLYILHRSRQMPHSRLSTHKASRNHFEGKKKEQKKNDPPSCRHNGSSRAESMRGGRRSGRVWSSPFYRNSPQPFWPRVRKRQIKHENNPSRLSVKFTPTAHRKKKKY